MSDVNNYATETKRICKKYNLIPSEVARKKGETDASWEKRLIGQRNECTVAIAMMQKKACDYSLFPSPIPVSTVADVCNERKKSWKKISSDLDKRNTIRQKTADMCNWSADKRKNTKLPLTIEQAYLERSLCLPCNDVQRIFNLAFSHVNMISPNILMNPIVQKASMFKVGKTYQLACSKGSKILKKDLVIPMKSEGSSNSVVIAGTKGCCINKDNFTRLTKELLVLGQISSMMTDLGKANLDKDLQNILTNFQKSTMVPRNKLQMIYVAMKSSYSAANVLADAVLDHTSIGLLTIAVSEVLKNLQEMIVKKMKSLDERRQASKEFDREIAQKAVASISVEQLLDDEQLLEQAITFQAAKQKNSKLEKLKRGLKRAGWTMLKLLLWVLKKIIILSPMVFLFSQITAAVFQKAVTDFSMRFYYSFWSRVELEIYDEHKNNPNLRVDECDIELTKRVDEEITKNIHRYNSIFLLLLQNAIMDKINEKEVAAAFEGNLITEILNANTKGLWKVFQSTVIQIVTEFLKKTVSDVLLGGFRSIIAKTISPDFYNRVLGDLKIFKTYHCSNSPQMLFQQVFRTLADESPTRAVSTYLENIDKIVPTQMNNKEKEQFAMITSKYKRLIDSYRRRKLNSIEFFNVDEATNSVDRKLQQDFNDELKNALESTGDVTGSTEEIAVLEAEYFTDSSVPSRPPPAYSENSIAKNDAEAVENFEFDDIEDRDEDIPFELSDSEEQRKDFGYDSYDNGDNDYF